VTCLHTKRDTKNTDERLDKSLSSDSYSHELIILYYSIYTVTQTVYRIFMSHCLAFTLIAIFFTDYE